MTSRALAGRIGYFAVLFVFVAVCDIGRYFRDGAQLAFDMILEPRLVVALNTGHILVGRVFPCIKILVHDMTGLAERRMLGSRNANTK